jgi:hypothetical protein
VFEPPVLWFFFFFFLQCFLFQPKIHLLASSPLVLVISTLDRMERAIAHLFWLVLVESYGALGIPLRKRGKFGRI